VALLVSIPAAYSADPKTVFEVDDGDTAPNGPPNCDWNTLNGAKTTDSNTPSAVCAGAGAALVAYGFFVGDQNEKNFSTGGSKDPLDISSWKWTVTSTPDKDTLTHAYAASYTAVGGNKVLVFGGERFAVNGDANIGIWFFQQRVGPNSSGGFDGVHVNGDVFAVSAFSNGGGHPKLDVYAWDTTCTNSHYPSPAAVGACADTNLRLIFSGSGGGLCNGGPGCATVNGAALTPSWPYATKFGGGSAIPVNGFFEGGFDLTAIFPADAGTCFSSFLMETRSSQEPSSVLKDFLGGSFPECHVSVSKACVCDSFKTDGPGYNYSAGGTVFNDGGGPIYNVVVTDNNITGSFNCGTMAKGAIKSWGNAPTGPDGVCTGPASFSFFNLSTSVSNTATATATSGPSLSSTPVPTATATVACAYPGPNDRCVAIPGIRVDKTCVTAIQVVGTSVVIRVDYTGKVKNAGNVNLTGVTVTDTASGTPGSQTFTIGTLTPNQEVCYTTNPLNSSCPNLVPPAAGTPPVTGAASYFPSSLTATAAGRASFTDRVVAAGTNASTKVQVTSDPFDATCLVCPFGFCPANP